MNSSEREEKKNMKAALQRETRTDNTKEYVSPQVNIFETKDGYVLEAEMPGVNKESLEITLEGTEITITGNRQLEPLPGNPLFRESNEVDYRRVFELDPAIDTSKVSARMDQGVLRLSLPKSERVKPRKISVD
jgi:HSP20 family protein